MKKADIYTKTIMLQYTPEMHEKLKYISKQNKKTISAQLRIFITNLIDLYEKKIGPIPTTSDSENKDENSEKVTDATGETN